VGGGELDVAFAGNAVIVMAAGGQLRVMASRPDRQIALLKNNSVFREGPFLLFTAPSQPGTYFMAFRQSGGTEAEQEFFLCVYVPYPARGVKADKGLDIQVNAVNIGNYRAVEHSGNAKVRSNPESYQPPRWWLRITPETAGLEIYPSLRLGELVAPSEDSGLPHTDMVPVNYPMWRVIFRLRQALEEKGIPGSALRLISVFRTPAYNRGVGSNAFGRHIYGDAFDFYIDLEGDGKASDLNHNGRLDRQDAYLIVSLIENLQADHIIPMGGIGVYHSPAGDHGLTLHLDLRGHRATWGYYYSPGGRRSEFAWKTRRFHDIEVAEEREAAQRAAREGRKYRSPSRELLPEN
jgi:hypothetical protein